MALYRLFDRILDSNIDLPAVDPVEASDPDLTFRLESGKGCSARTMSWQRHWRQLDGKIVLSYSKNTTSCLLRFPQVADFYFSEEQKLIQCYVKHKSIDRETISHLLLDQVLPRILSLQGDVLIHASSIQTPGAIVAFMGDSGSGKSTLAAAFHSLGLPVLSDDCILLRQKNDRIIGIPSYRAIRLWPDSASMISGNKATDVYTDPGSNKRRVAMGASGMSSATKSRQLNRIYFLDNTDQNGHIPGIKRISKRDGLILLTRNSFHLTDLEIESVERLLSQMESIIDAVPVFSLTFPRDYALLNSVCSAILDRTHV